MTTATRTLEAFEHIHHRRLKTHAKREWTLDLIAEWWIDIRMMSQKAPLKTCSQWFIKMYNLVLKKNRQTPTSLSFGPRAILYPLVHIYIYTYGSFPVKKNGFKKTHWHRLTSKKKQNFSVRLPYLKAPCKKYPVKVAPAPLSSRRGPWLWTSW